MEYCYKLFHDQIYNKDQFEYNDKGYISKITHCPFGGKPNGTVEYEYNYSDSGKRLSATIVYSGADSVIYNDGDITHADYYYDDNDLLIGIKSAINNEPERTRSDHITYDSNGNYTEIKWNYENAPNDYSSIRFEYENGELKHSYYYSRISENENESNDRPDNVIDYDSNGNPVYATFGNATINCTYSYDSNGSLIKMDDTEFDNSSLSVDKEGQLVL